PNECTFFNFTASHDGVGVRPLEGLVPSNEFSDLVEGMKAAGAHISTKRNSDGSDSPYEMNITYLDALGQNKEGDTTFAIDRFLCSQTIMMTLQGVPAFYIHSLLGTHNYYEGVKETGMPRSINRRKWNSEDLDAQLTSATDQKTIFDELRRLISIRKSTNYFHPNAKQQILNISDELFIVLRGDHKELLSISNMTAEEQSIDSSLLHGTYVFDLLSNEKIHSGGDNFVIKPYQTFWLVNK
ncbi:MAG: hypothetical protein MI922_28430, partial [Bacteroidales bacterium]|nr:hypothetical protein [Bacteroidales bacterium]